MLRQLGASLLVTTYQAGKLVVCDEGDYLNVHFRAFQAPMGLALSADGERLAVGTKLQVWEFVNVPAVAAKLDPLSRHDACYLPRSGHVTGDIQIHQLAWVLVTNCGSSTPGYPACVPLIDRPTSHPGGDRGSSRRWSRRTGATATASAW